VWDFLKEFYAPIEVLGIVTGVLVMISYFLVSRKKVKSDRAVYNLMVLSCCILYFIYGVVKKAPAVIFLQVFFASLVGKALYNCCWKKKGADDDNLWKIWKKELKELIFVFWLFLVVLVILF